MKVISVLALIGALMVQSVISQGNNFNNNNAQPQPQGQFQGSSELGREPPVSSPPVQPPVPLPVPGPLGPGLPFLHALVPPILPPILPFFPPLFPPFLGGLGFRRFLFGKRDTQAVEDISEPQKRTSGIAGDLPSEFAEVFPQPDTRGADKMIGESENLADMLSPPIERELAAVIDKLAGDKLSVEKVMNEREAAPVVAPSEPRTLCLLSSEDLCLKCSVGGERKFQCNVTAQIRELGSIRLKLADLVPVRREHVYDLVGRSLNITAVNPVDKRDLTISIWRGEQKNLSGFIVEDEKCFGEWESLVESIKPEDIRLSLFITQTI